MLRGLHLRHHSRRPRHRATAACSWLRGVPIFYAPAFYKSLKKNPRSSGFLTPNIGNSSRRGKMLGVGYYWAINRSYDLSYLVQYFTDRGFAHHIDLRGKAERDYRFRRHRLRRERQGHHIGDTSRNRAEYLAYFNGTLHLAHGWEARGELNYLSSFDFARTSPSVPRGHHSPSLTPSAMSRNTGRTSVSTSSLDRDVVFQITATPRTNDRPQTARGAVHRSRAPVIREGVPALGLARVLRGFLNRDEPLYTTREFVDRVDFEPRVMTALYWKGFSLAASFGIRETHYGSSFATNIAIGDNSLSAIPVRLPSTSASHRSPASSRRPSGPAMPSLNTCSRRALLSAT